MRAAGQPSATRSSTPDLRHPGTRLVLIPLLLRGVPASAPASFALPPRRRAPCPPACVVPWRGRRASGSGRCALSARPWASRASPGTNARPGTPHRSESVRSSASVASPCLTPPAQRWPASERRAAWRVARLERWPAPLAGLARTRDMGSPRRHASRLALRLPGLSWTARIRKRAQPRDRDSDGVQHTREGQGAGPTELVDGRRADFQQYRGLPYREPRSRQGT